MCWCSLGEQQNDNICPASMYALNCLQCGQHIWTEKRQIWDLLWKAAHFWRFYIIQHIKSATLATVVSNADKGIRNELKWIHVPVYRYIPSQYKFMKKQNFWGEILKKSRFLSLLGGFELKNPTFLQKCATFSLVKTFLPRNFVSSWI